MTSEERIAKMEEIRKVEKEDKERLAASIELHYADYTPEERQAAENQFRIDETTMIQALRQHQDSWKTLRSLASLRISDELRKEFRQICNADLSSEMVKVALIGNKAQQDELFEKVRFFDKAQALFVELFVMEMGVNALRTHQEEWTGMIEELEQFKADLIAFRKDHPEA